jgi:hypothetical protein
LADLKASNPVEVAEYSVANQQVEEPAFKWWVSHGNRIISKVKSRYWKTTHKFGIRLPKLVKEALEIDRIMNTDLWRKLSTRRCLVSRLHGRQMMITHHSK